MTLRILLLGSGDVGSAVAHRLFLHGADVVLADVTAPAHPRRGMAFTDAWFSGTATLEGVVAQLVPEGDELASSLADLDAVLATVARPDEVVSKLQPDALIDARMRKRAVPDDLRALAPVLIGLGPGFTPGQNCTMAIETAWGEHLGDVFIDEPASALAGEPRKLGGAGRERFVYADEDGVWCTSMQIGERVSEDSLIGTLAGRSVRAPLTGVLRGLTHDGISVRARQKLVEVDPSSHVDSHGLGARPAIIARGVARALGLPTGVDAAFFGFEAEFKATLDCMPMSMRMKLDRCRLKLSLEQWRALPQPVRETLLEIPADSHLAIARLERFLRRRCRQFGWDELPTIADDETLAAATAPDAVPFVVRQREMLAGATTISLAHWSAMTELQRYALAKLAGNRSGRNWQDALREFGVS